MERAAVMHVCAAVHGYIPLPPPVMAITRPLAENRSLGLVVREVSILGRFREVQQVQVKCSLLFYPRVCSGSHHGNSAQGIRYPSPQMKRDQKTFVFPHYRSPLNQ